MYGQTSLLFFALKSIFVDGLVLDFRRYSLADAVFAALNGLSFGLIQGGAD